VTGNILLRSRIPFNTMTSYEAKESFSTFSHYSVPFSMGVVVSRSLEITSREIADQISRIRPSQKSPRLFPCVVTRKYPQDASESIASLVESIH